TSVTDHETMVKDLKKEVDAGRNLEIILIDSESDGIARITETLAKYDDLDAVHIYSHGSEGQIRLGNSWIDQTTLSQNVETTTAWGDAMSKDGDILLYGCNLASTTEGERFINTLAQLTGADIAASDDLTGHESLGGDWDLEVKVGDIESGPLIDQQAQDLWVNVLATSEGPDQNVQVDENTIFVATMGAGDQDEPPHSIVGGTDAALFQVSHSPGSFYLFFNAAPNYESPADSNGDNVYEVTVNFNDVIYDYYVTVNDANDAPTAAANTVTTNEDTTYTFSASDFSYSDIDSDTMASIKITTLETVGNLQLSGVDVTLNQVISKANIDAGNLKFVPVTNANGSSYDSF
ncbi:MAG: DUF4347 domain-containing protein, partial [Planctomycetaceae bacterium]|nr:DUF4347 domain-containing protein [Planctomycetaceae bacterium]